MELQLAAMLASVVIGGALLVVFMSKWWGPLADDDRLVKELADAVDALLELRADVLKNDNASSSEQARGWLRRVQEAQDEAAFVRARHDDKQPYMIRLVQYCLSNGAVASLAEERLKAVRALREQGKALLEAALAAPPPPPPLLRLPEELELTTTPETEYVRPYVNQALRFLGDHERALGIWGAGGVGKTTVLRQVRDLCGLVASFDHVLLVTASRECTVAKVQREVVSVLGLREAPTEQAQAAGIQNFLRDKSFLLLLDGLSERVDLDRVGIPQPLSAAAGRPRKVIVTARSEAVCADMGCRRRLKMECLKEEDAWRLFEAKVGVETATSHPQIPALAKQVAAECKGLPLALATVGCAMSNKRVPEEWEKALDALKKSQLSCATGSDKSSYPVVKFCYDNLETDVMRECFLTCALWPEGHSIFKDELVQNWMGLGVVPDFADVDDAHRFGRSVIAALEAAGLLEQGDNHRYNMYPSDTHVRVHDVVRDAALRIAPGKWLVRSGVGLREPPRDEVLWQNARRVSLMYNDIEDAAHAGAAVSRAQPTSLMLQCNRSLPPSMFQAIQHLTMLTYLDLEDTGILDAFPMEICCLVRLEYLNLSRNRIQSLPMELSNLSQLKYLYLRDNYYIQITIPPGLISQLGKLRVLDVVTGSIVSVTENYVAPVVDDLESAGASLASLGIWLDTMRDVQRLTTLAPRVRARSLHLRKLEGERALPLLSARYSPEYGGVQESLKELLVYSSDVEEIVADGCAQRLEVLKLGFLLKLHSVVWAPHGSNIRELAVGACHSLTHLTWVQHLPCLESLNISGCNGITRVIGAAAAATDGERADHVVTFPRLRLLSLLGLPRLEAICDGACAMPELRRVQARGCSRLRSIPMRPASGQAKVRVECDKHWWDALQWASDDAKSHFVAVLF